MEKQTIGQFLSALRRSNGYTQQDVAEKLGVSNKTVSCWERDAYSPDIATIPALAELYGVTCDEILRAKRTPATDAAEGYEDEKARSYAFKAEKEASAIFDNMLARYDNTHKIATAAALFAVLFSVFAAAVTISLADYVAAGFFFEHRSYGNGSITSDMGMSIDELEERTGLDFFVNLKEKYPTLADKIEAQDPATVGLWWN